MLYRTNAQSRLFEEKFMGMEIPYVIIGGLKFYDRKEIKDILAYLHVIANPYDDLHIMRIINTPRRGIGSTNLNKLTEFATAQGLSIMETIANKKLLAQMDLPPRFCSGLQGFAAMMMSFTESAKNLAVDKLINTVLNESGYMKMLQDNKNAKEENISREENLGTFIDSAKEFLEMNPTGTLQDFLNHVALITDIDTLDENESRVRLMTVHAAKGLEFPVVFMVGMEDGIFPHVMSLDSDESLEEERRACYVAITRAKKKLYITAADARMSFGQMRSQKISRFIEEIPDACVESYGTRFKPPQRKSVRFNYKPPTAYRPAQIKPPEKKSPPITLHVGDIINHKKWGIGSVMDVDKGIVTIAFANPEVGTKKLVISAAPINKM